jgi:Cu(I)/Ag(I) efflux system membrane fusion protein|nr:MAG: hypothetical protein DIU61_07365 [Bacteroidota bacterium]
MIRKLKNSVGIIVILLLTMASCNRHDHSAQEEVYTCPMHPTVVSKQPGSCPVCGMELVRHGGPGEDLAMTPELSRVLKSPDEAILASVKTVRAEYKSLPVDVAVNGVVTYDTRTVQTIPARVAGRLERVYITYELQPVRAGQKVAEIYSPELSTTQRELIFLLENDPENKALIDASRRKLELLGMSPSQINALETGRQATSTISIYSPYSGYVVMRGPDMGTGMSERLVRAGDYVSVGQKLFTVVDSKAIRIELNVPGTTGHNVRQGTRALLNIGGKDQEVIIDFVEPFVADGQPFTRLRVYSQSGESLRIGSLVSGRIRIDGQESLWIPRQSVIDLGTQQIVFVQQRGLFRPKAVRTGIRSDGMIEIKEGLATSDEIAENAQFLVDSESFVKPLN